jgi:hypothetical protein
MSLSNYIRWGAIATIIAGVTGILGGLSSIPMFTEEGHSWYQGGTFWHLVEFVGSVALVVGLVGLYLYLRRSPRFGLLGTVGVFLLIVFTAYEAILPLTAEIAGPAAAKRLDSIGPLQALGKILSTLLFGIAILRAGTLPRAGAWLLIVAVLVYSSIIVSFIVGPEAYANWGFPIATGLYGLALIALGYGLWAHRGEPVQPTRAAPVT